ncbi:HAD family hydrolase [Piscinibacter sp.]|uniref:sulfotransferase-like domain-containing protein n=1 Tax=Piscinibacter sp. TaxID=1903157 RepID=UPI002C23E602|nr:HAD family hydrolase [Albitalea sp.]HUG25218.1 HAD family hydrolase [Albitalea sp.]
MKPVRIAAWSGPRNISTAMMRSWENRSDCAVSDEPLYAHYLQHTQLDHPGRDDVIAAGDTDWRRVVAALTTGPAPDGRAVWYQKHMTHHLLPGMGVDWVHGLANVFLIRDPTLVVASYVKSRATVAAEDIGLLQQATLFDIVAQRLGHAPPVIDAERFLRDPQTQLKSLCKQLGVAFTERMLHWPAGPRASDGVWAPYWYEAVWKSTGFELPRERQVLLEGDAARAADACRPAYEMLLRHCNPQ